MKSLSVATEEKEKCINRNNIELELFWENEMQKIKTKIANIE